MDIDSLLDEFIQALKQEIDCLKTNIFSKTNFILQNGELLNSDNDTFIYEFITDEPLELDDDTPINIQYEGKTVMGTIITIKGLKVQICVNENLGPKIPKLVINTDPYYLLENLQKMLSEVRLRKIKINDEIAMKAFGFKDSKVSRDNIILTPISTFPLKWPEEKTNALRTVSGSEVTFIWGPPGTGKTTFISYAVNELLLRNQSILLISHTNVAIDNALEKVVGILQKCEDIQNNEYNKGEILRIGNPADPHFFEDKYQKLKLDYWLDIKSKQLIEKLNNLEEENNINKILLNRLNAILELFITIEDNELKISKITKEMDALNDEITNSNIKLSHLKQELEKTKIDLERAKSGGFFVILFTYLNPQRLEKNLKNLSYSITKEEDKLEQNIQDLNFKKETLKNIRKEHKKYRDELEKLLKTQDNQKITKRDVIKNIQRQQSLIHGIEQQVASIKSDLQQLRHNIISNAKLIGTTITKGYLDPDIYMRHFDAVVVDEASMASLPALFFNLGLAISKVVIVGDFRQLAPIAKSDDPLVQKWLKKDIFEIAGITRKINEGLQDPRLLELKEQRRMPLEIANLVNEPIYQNRLKSKEKNNKDMQEEIQVTEAKPFSNNKIILCDTSKFNPWCTKSVTSQSPFNIYNAFLSVYLAGQAVNDGVSNIAILTPYRAQNRLIHKLIHDKKLEKYVIPSTVHRFQGKECSLVIFDLVEGPLRKINWLGGGLDSEAMRLINVAITRAKAKIIFIANLQYLKSHLKDVSILKQILNIIERDYLVADSTNFFHFIDNSSQKNESIEMNNNITYLCSESSFYDRFLIDLSYAKNKVIIASPFISSKRLTYFEMTFRQLVQKGIDIAIITKPFKEQKLSKDNSYDIVDNLRKIGIEIISKPSMHEKVAIIDNRIIWFGSLNILSHNKTSELMTRFITNEKSFSEEVLKLCGINIERTREEQALNKKIDKLNKKGVGFCSQGHPLVVRRGSHGLFLACSEFPRHKETHELSLDLVSEIFGNEYIYCSECGERLVIRFSYKNKRRFLGCPNYPSCHFTRPL